MPQGLQTWGPTGVLEVDTSAVLLKELVINATASATSTSAGYVNVDVPSNTNAIAMSGVTNLNGDASNNQAPPETHWDEANSRVHYKYGSGGNRVSELRVIMV